MVDPDSQRQQPGSRARDQDGVAGAEVPVVRGLSSAVHRSPLSGRWERHFSIFPMAVSTGHHKPTLSGLLIRIPDEEHNDLVAEVAYIGGVATLENLSHSEPPLAAKFDDSPVFARRLWLNDLLPFRDPFRTTEKRYFEPRTIGGEGSRPICGRRREGAGNGDSRVKVSDSVSFGPHCGYISAGRECARRDSNP